MDELSPLLSLEAFAVPRRANGNKRIFSELQHRGEEDKLTVARARKVPFFLVCDHPVTQEPRNLKSFAKKTRNKIQRS